MSKEDKVLEGLTICRDCEHSYPHNFIPDYEVILCAKELTVIDYVTGEHYQERMPYCYQKNTDGKCPDFKPKHQEPNE